MSNPYESSKAAASTATDEEEDLGPLHTPMIVGIAGFAVGAVGLFGAGAGAQLLSVVTIYSWVWVLPPVLVVLGAITTVVGAFLAIGRFWAAMLGAVLSGMLGLLQAFWTLYALFGGFFSLLPFVAALLSGVACGLALFAIFPAKRVSDQRARLMSA